MLTIHHLGKSQSERIIWLCEELGTPYGLKLYARDPQTILAPPELKALHPSGAAPVIQDENKDGHPVVLAESGAVVDYILTKYGRGRLVVRADEPGFADYLYWLHFANGTLQPNMARNMMVRRLELPADNPVAALSRGRLERNLLLVDDRLRAVPFLAGAALTAADIMTVFCLTTMRVFMPVDLSPYPGILAYLQRIGARPAYRRAMANGDPDMAPLLA